MRQHVAAAPPLVPIFRHVSLPADPCEADNPVLSVYQADIIYRGRNLAEYLGYIGSGEEMMLQRCDEVRHIRFWSELVEANDGCH
ncbi:SMI1/KNR4 family protein [Limnoglobus roseus]|uniref:SMI1/KNR4 family protein n=2 Tax=Limnoglobus roseus TaxID=2598579 RepID=A0A5C1A9J6_9BACT|nr:SMI1/KNR4 family protein [Limnoglobus roseus]